MTEVIGPLRLLFDGTVRRSARVSSRYSRFVGVMKLVLPLTAALLVGLVVMWPDSDLRRGGLGLPFANTSVGADGEAGMERVRYVGTDRLNRPFVVTAGRVTPRSTQAQRFALEELQADMTLDDGRWVTLMAARGLYDRDRETLRLEGSVDIYSDDGLELHTDSAFVDFVAGRARGSDPVRGQGPLGLLNARAFELLDNGRRILFTGGVSLTVRPGSDG